MEIIGLIAEYNPFHNGHLYQINKIKELYPDSLIVCVCSTSFSQRGEISILNKWEKTLIALNNQIDIFLELPYFFAVQSADTFAHAALEILNEFKINKLVFGSENNNIKVLTALAKENIKNNKIFKEYTKKGFSFPAIFSKLYNSPKTPNDILAVSYIKEIIKNNYNIEPISIKRTSSYHDKISTASIVSASNIREKFYKTESIKAYVPCDTYEILKNKKINKNMFFDLIKYKVLIDNDLDKYLDVCEGIENRITNTILKHSHEDEIIKTIKSKRYTYNRIYRMLNHILIGLTKEDAKKIKNIEYLRVLGFNKKGRIYLSKIKRSVNYPIIHNYNKKYKTSEYELLSTKIYSLINDDKQLIASEYKKSSIIIK